MVFVLLICYKYTHVGSYNSGNTWSCAVQIMWWKKLMCFCMYTSVESWQPTWRSQERTKNLKYYISFLSLVLCASPTIWRKIFGINDLLSDERHCCQLKKKVPSNIKNALRHNVIHLFLIIHSITTSLTSKAALTKDKCQLQIKRYCYTHAFIWVLLCTWLIMWGCYCVKGLR